jgi:hypothetical protein
LNPEKIAGVTQLAERCISVGRQSQGRIPRHPAKADRVASKPEDGVFYDITYFKIVLPIPYTLQITHFLFQKNWCLQAKSPSPTFVESPFDGYFWHDFEKDYVLYLLNKTDGM